MITKLKNIIKIILLILKVYGFNFKRFKKSISNTRRFYRDLKTYNLLNKEKNIFKIKWKKISPILYDYDENAGNISGYFVQDLWAARKVYRNKPSNHIDIGSIIDGFISNLLVFMDVTVVDIRKLESGVKGLKFIRADALNILDFNEKYLSISSLHAAEHFGLGRYGDKVDPDGHIKFINNLQNILLKNGILLFSVPLGNNEVIFNSHRAFDPKTIIKYFDSLKLLSFSVIDKHNNLIENIEIEKIDNFSIYKIGLFEFTK